MEADFLNCARRVASRERDARVADRKVVKVESRAFGVLYAEVVQEVQNVKAKVWLRPLILNSFEDDTFLDLRGGSDIVLDSEVVEDVDSDTRLRLSVNLLATEGDVVSRAISDDDWNVTSSKCVMKFLQTLSLGGPSDLHE